MVVTGREQLIELAKAWPQGGLDIAQSAATIALVAWEPEDHLHHDWLMYDFGQLTAYMLLAAADLGIGSGHSAVRDQGQAPATPRAANLTKVGSAAANRPGTA